MPEGQLTNILALSFTDRKRVHKISKVRDQMRQFQTTMKRLAVTNTEISNYRQKFDNLF